MAGRQPGTMPAPAAAGRITPPLFLLVLVAAGSSIAALLLHAFGLVRMPYAISFVSLPGLVLLVALVAWTRHSRRSTLFNRLVVGSVGGLIGTAGYDLGRWLLNLVPQLSFDPFLPIVTFGSLITSQPASTAVAVGAGWAYHVSNGLTFGVAYAVIAGPARWWWGLVWGLVLEVGMISVYPLLFDRIDVGPFLVISIAGHVVYGGLLGGCCQRYAAGRSA